MLATTSLKKTFHAGSPDERKALNGVDLILETGQFCIIIGSNGAGKSTLLNAVSGKLVVDEGRIDIDGTDVTALPVHRRAKWIARVFQDPMIGTATGMTVEENLLLADMRNGKARLRFGLTHQRRELYRERLSVLGLGLEDRLEARVDLLSGGQRQALSLIMATSNNPSVLLLDEHTAALDPKTAAQVMEATVKAVESMHLTTLMVTHNMQHAIDYGDKLIMMDSGQIKMTLGKKEKSGMTVEDMVERFHITDDKILLAD